MEEKELGMGWFKFFTKWRPWITFSFTILLVINATGYYHDVYLGNIFGIISFIGSIVETIFGLILFFKVKNNNDNIFNLIKGILAFEVGFFTYQVIIGNSYEDITHLTIMSIITAVIYYFLWYKTNMKYFDKRLNVKKEKKEINSEQNNITINDKTVKEINLSDPNEVVIRDRSNSFNVYSEDIRLHNDTDKKYCTNCGKNIEDFWSFCNHCGYKLK